MRFSLRICFYFPRPFSLPRLLLSEHVIICSPNDAKSSCFKLSSYGVPFLGSVGGLPSKKETLSLLHCSRNLSFGFFLLPQKGRYNISFLEKRKGFCLVMILWLLDLSTSILSWFEVFPGGPAHLAEGNLNVQVWNQSPLPCSSADKN